MYIYGFDYLRLVSVAAVLGIHTFSTAGGLRDISQQLSFAVPCFVLMAAYLSCHSVQKGRPRFMPQRVRRLAPAFLAWTVVYLAARIAHGGIGVPSFSDVTTDLFFGAGALHLYFVPMILYYSAMILILPRSRLPRVSICTFSFCAAVLLRFYGIPVLRLGSPEADAFPFYFFYNLPYLFAGVLLFDWIEKNRDAWFHHHAGYFSLLSGAGALWVWVLPANISSFVYVQYILRDVLLFLAFRFLPFRSPKWLSVAASLTLGVYLSHHLILEGLKLLEEKLGMQTFEITVTLLRYGTGVVLSLALCYLLAHMRRTAWLVR
jgi:peptidoglycan/LPS O-acetylase OafA/YrhL